MARHPATPDCGIKDCTRAAYRFGLCRVHAEHLPRRFAVDKLGEQFAFNRKLNAKYVRLAVTHVTRQLADSP